MEVCFWIRLAEVELLPRPLLESTFSFDPNTEFIDCNSINAAKSQFLLVLVVFCGQKHIKEYGSY